jgi:colicin import membrane protein
MAVGVRDRIFDAANALYEEAGRLVFPTVDAVRKRARVNMNDASTTMKEWRRAQTVHVAPVTVQVPQSLQQASSAALADIWAAAVAFANESLRAAQAGWEADRAESETLAQQMASAFEEQASELDETKAAMVDLERRIAAAISEAASLRDRLSSTLGELDIARAAAKQADAKATEIERRAHDLRLELDHAHQLAAAASEDHAAWQLRANREIEGLRSEVRNVKADAELESSRAQAALTSAIATAARLRGQIEGLTMAEPGAIGKKTRRKPAPDGQASGTT